MVFIRYKKIGNMEYAYEVTSYWDKEKKAPRQRSRYLGQVVDKEKGIIVKPGRVRTEQEKMILDFGDSYFLMKFMEKEMTDIYNYLKKTGALSSVLYRILNKSAMRRAKTWQDGNIAGLLCPDDLTSQRITEFLVNFGEERNIREFYRLYVHSPESGISIDTTALPNQIDLDITQWGYSSDTVDEEIKLVLVMDRKNNRPLYFRYIPGGILDVSSLTTTDAEMKQLGINSTLTILDAGFFSEDNIISLCDDNTGFLIRVPANRSFYHDLIESSQDIENPDLSAVYGKRIMFIKTGRMKYGNHDVYVHTVLDPERRGRELRRYLIKHRKDFNRFSVKRKGFMVLMSSMEIKKEDIIPLYYTRQFVEKAFSYSKDDLSLLPLRVHSDDALRGYLFLIFISLIVYMGIQKKIGSVEISLDILRNLKCKVFKKEIVVQEPTKEQKELFEKIGVIVPNTMEI